MQALSFFFVIVLHKHEKPKGVPVVNTLVKVLSGTLTFCAIFLIVAFGTDSLKEHMFFLVFAVFTFQSVHVLWNNN